MEKVIFENSEGLRLSGVIYEQNEKSDNIIVISHGFTSTKERPRLIKLAEALSNEGFSVFRYDCRTSGESEEGLITTEGYVDDLKSAMMFLKASDYSKFGLMGESLGGLSSILAYNEDVLTMVLQAPVTKGANPDYFDTEEARKEFNENGFVMYKKDGKYFKVPKQYLDERKSINQKEILSNIKCPVLIIHGSDDESIPIEYSRESIQHLPEGSKIEVIDGGDHKLDNKTEETIPLTIDWFNKFLI